MGVIAKELDDQATGLAAVATLIIATIVLDACADADKGGREIVRVVEKTRILIAHRSKWKHS